MELEVLVHFLAFTRPMHMGIGGHGIFPMLLRIQNLMLAEWQNE